MKHAFYFTLKALFVLRIFKFWLGHAEKIRKITLVKEWSFKCGWCGFSPDYPHWNHIHKVGNAACIWFIWVYSFVILWLECGLCGSLNFNNILCGLFVAFVDLCKSLILKPTCDMGLIWLHVDSVSIYTLKSQSSLSLKPNFRGGRRNNKILL